MKWLFWILLLSIATGCNRPNPNPETTDPIYLDISSDLRSAEARYIEAIKAVEEAKALAVEAKPRSLDKTIAREELKKAKLSLKYTEQEVEFLKIRQERRRIEGRAAYKRAFAKKEKWPVPSEYDNYLVNKRLVNAPKTWSKRLQAIQSGRKTESP